MTVLLVWILASFGLAYVCGHAFITRSLREWAFKKPVLTYLVMLVECPACFGYWIGTFTGIWAFRRAGIPVTWWEASFVGSFLVCGTNFILGQWTGLIPPVEAPDKVPVDVAVWQKKAIQGGVDAMKEGIEAGRQQDSQAVSEAGLGVCLAGPYPVHHGLHWHLESCVNWRQVQDVSAQANPQEAQR